VPKEIQWFINAQKDEGLRPQHLDDERDPNRRQMIALYAAYEEICQRGGLVDFAELLLRAHELWRDNPDLLAHYQRRFQHLLVDEFQDTNAIQYAWLRLLAGDNAAIPFVVGDDDQSIYRWRGARVEHIHRFQRDFPSATVVKLEQNYRSTATILNAANAVIANNADRMGKNLWTEGAEGEPIRLYAAYNERDEADFVIGRLRDWIDQGNARADAAILYRSNAQSRVLEEGLINAGIPYRVYGGLRFFERAEIKDALAYLRLISHREDDASFERIVNRPTRGIGARTVEIMRAYARANSCTMWRAAGAVASDELAGRAANAVLAFINLIERMARETTGLDLQDKVDHVIHASGLVEMFRNDKGERGETKLENLMELVSAAKSFEPDPAGEMSPLDEFLSHAALEAGEGQAEAWEDCAPASTLDRRPERPGGRKAPVLRRHHAREADPVRDLRGAASPSRHGQFFPAVALHFGDPRRLRRGDPAARAGITAGSRAALRVREFAEEVIGCRDGRAARPARPPRKIRRWRHSQLRRAGRPRQGRGQF
jgi:DNA helicase-2/ATP-dependent DNA helicase PcrA